MTAEQVLVELLYLREMRAQFMRLKQRRVVSIQRDPEAVAEWQALKAEVDRREAAAWQAARDAVRRSTT